MSKVEQFITDTKDIDAEKGEIVLALRALVHDLTKTVDESIKYGGIVFTEEGELLSGIFVYKKHISLEFSFGAELNDPNVLLEGKGKLRRHLKFTSKQDLETKMPLFYIKQTFTS